MLQLHLDALNILSTPVWVVSPKNQQIIFANTAAEKLAVHGQLAQLRNGKFSAHAQLSLESYLPALLKDEQIVEIWTVEREGNVFPLSCHLSLMHFDKQETTIIFEGINAFGIALPVASPCQNTGSAMPNCHDERGFYERLFHTNTAPILLIDPAAEGRIVYANLAASHFYGYSREEMCLKHTWEINVMGRDVLPIMYEIARLPGGHKPLNFIHKLADGNLRHVQTYAGPVVLDGVRLMLCIIHDITEQKRLEQELEHAALRDALTGLGNRRQFLQLVERTYAKNQYFAQDFSLMLVDADHFKAINDQHGHHKGDEALISLARALEAGIRDSDTVFRWGGEEFVILLPLTNLQGALHVAESLRASVQQLSLPNQPQLTVSIGVAQHQVNEDSASLFKRMDDALYRAKTSGRNKVVAGEC
ncbi:GGDEF domain-containing protein [Ewingella sp. S1.OA.A_B6]